MPLEPRPRLPWASALLAVLAAAVPAHAQADAPLPDAASLVAAVRTNLFRETALATQYTFTERRQSLEADRAGGFTVKRERVYEVYPAGDPRLTYRRLVLENGSPPADLARKDEKHHRAVAKRLEEQANETPAARERRLRKEAEARRRDEAQIDDALGAYRIVVVGREVLEGRPAVLVTLTPLAEARPRTRAGKLAKKLRGRAWVDEQDRELARVELEVFDTVSFGFGLVARVHEGSTVHFRRRKVNDEVWLPAEARIQASGRVALLRRVRVNEAIAYSDYRKFSADAQIVSFGPTKEPQ
jgi:hypothetical protein